MATLSSMVDEVSRKLSGFTLHQDSQTYLTTVVPATYSNTAPSSIKVNSADNISTGIIEIGNELIWVDSYDRDNNTLTIPPYGRGYNGTTVTSHPVGARVTISPTFPNVDVKNAINETIYDVFPGLFAIKNYTFSYNPSIVTYTLPDDVENILAISWKSTGPTKEWIPVRNWRIDRMSNPDSFDSNISLNLYDIILPGRTVQVTYSSQPQSMENLSDEFSTTTGLNDSAKDVIILGASYRLSAFIDPGRLTFGSAEADQQSQIAGRSYGAGTAASKYLLALYQQRLQQEINKIQGRYPIRLHHTR
jgi:hypothetical protein